jgi:hypothetical protein
MDDLEHLKKLSNKEIYAQVLLDIYGRVPIKSYLTNDEYDIEIIKRLKFENIGDNKKLRNCIDLIEDTELAIKDFFKYGLYKDEKSHGEMYLRLYGILNTVSLQIEGIIELIELLKILNKTSLKNKLKGLKVIEIRNKIASHAVSYNDNLGDKEIRDSFGVTRVSLSKWAENISIVSNHKGHEEINLFVIIEDFNDISEEILKSIISKALYSLFKNDSEDRRYLEKCFEIANTRTFEYPTDNRVFL